MTTTPALTPNAVAGLSAELRQACMRISRRVRFEGTGALVPHQMSVLLALSKGDRRPGELASQEKVSAPSMTRTLNCLEQDGLVSRRDDPDDRRQVIVSLTDAGRAAVTATRRRRDGWMHQRVAALPPDQQRVLAEAAVILQRVADA